MIGTDVTIRGDIEASVDLHVDGKVIGNIECASLVQGESSRVEGEIKAESARLSGEVQGTIEVRDLVVLKSAKINGDVSYDTLTIEQGATVDGRFAPLRAKSTQAARPAPEKAEGETQQGLTLAS
ncbi:bactofilin family protein [Aurantiacibacter poecillastricola]|uniref:bactofilin family protein n=1 Tax=Aurantiacibacter poecillastricola TaxID=3064385 RepID=UPI0035A3D407